jgi:hypothetical protein
LALRPLAAVLVVRKKMVQPETLIRAVAVVELQALTAATVALVWLFLQCLALCL